MNKELLKLIENSEEYYTSNTRFKQTEVKNDSPSLSSRTDEVEVLVEKYSRQLNQNAKLLIEIDFLKKLLNRDQRKLHKTYKSSIAYLEHRDDIMEVKKIKEKNKRATDPLYKLKGNVQNAINTALKKKGFKKTCKHEEYLGCTIAELRGHLESKFTEGMSWKNQGQWHVDHIVPTSSANTKHELLKLFHYTNLQPLWAVDNIKKSDKI